MLSMTIRDEAIRLCLDRDITYYNDVVDEDMRLYNRHEDKKGGNDTRSRLAC